MSFQFTLMPFTVLLGTHTGVMWMRWCLSKLVNLLGLEGIPPTV